VNAYVLDASVAAKWFLPAAHETLTEQALRLFEDYAANRIRLVVPDLFWPEIGNLLESLARGANFSGIGNTSSRGADGGGNSDLAIAAVAACGLHDRFSISPVRLRFDLCVTGYCIETNVCDSRRAAGKRRCSTLPCPVVGCAVSVGSRTVEA